jgi:hypothetical protein
LNFITKLYESIQEPITFISARPLSLKDITEEWFDAHFGETIQYNVICCDHGKNKEEHLDGFKYFVEDDPTHADSICKKVDKLFILDRPWNLGTDIGYNKSIERIDRVSDLWEICNFNI